MFFFVLVCKITLSRTPPVASFSFFSLTFFPFCGGGGGGGRSGTGSGLLAMLAAKSGAEHVYAIEANKHLTSLAEHIIECNGLSDNITVVNKLSTQVDVEVDIPKRANVLVSDCGWHVAMPSCPLAPHTLHLLPTACRQYCWQYCRPSAVHTTPTVRYGGNMPWYATRCVHIAIYRPLLTVYACGMLGYMLGCMRAACVIHAYLN